MNDVLLTSIVPILAFFTMKDFLPPNISCIGYCQFATSWTSSGSQRSKGADEGNHRQSGNCGKFREPPRQDDLCHSVIDCAITSLCASWDVLFASSERVRTTMNTKNHSKNRSMIYTMPKSENLSRTSFLSDKKKNLSLLIIHTAISVLS